MATLDPRSFAPPARLTSAAQTRLTDEESLDLDAFVSWCNEHGVEASRSSAIRTFVQMGLRAYQAEQEKVPAGE